MESITPFTSKKTDDFRSYHNPAFFSEKYFTILDHHNGDSYSIVSENAEERDSKVLKFFCGLFEDIVKKITK